jgi:hypothetical protein
LVRLVDILFLRHIVIGLSPVAKVPASMRPNELDGKSLTPRVLDNQPLSADSVAVSQFHGGDLAMSWYLIRYKEWKLITYGTGQEVPPQLFNLTQDPGEMTNLQSDYPEVVAQLDAMLKQQIDYPGVSLDVARYNQVRGSRQRWIGSDIASRTWGAGGSTALALVGTQHCRGGSLGRSRGQSEVLQVAVTMAVADVICPLGTPLPPGMLLMIGSTVNPRFLPAEARWCGPSQSKRRADSDLG